MEDSDMNLFLESLAAQVEKANLPLDNQDELQECVLNFVNEKSKNYRNKI